MVIPYATYRLNKLGGIVQVFKTPLPGDTPFDEAWAHRAYRAHMNTFEGIALFAPLAIAAHIAGTGNEVTAMACAVYFWARVVYAPLYYFEMPYLKTTAWSIGLTATLVLAYQLLA
ncbi:MAG: MAPEG family protein [Proteobacteria bacterium]|nr:MAPEG family protein [Pseudomonadota bacterium]